MGDSTQKGPLWVSLGSVFRKLFGNICLLLTHCLHTELWGRSGGRHYLLSFPPLGISSLNVQNGWDLGLGNRTPCYQRSITNHQFWMP